MDGLDLCSRFAMGASQEGLKGKAACWKPNLHQKYVEYARTKQGKIEEEIQKMPIMYPYLTVISKKHNLPVFDYKVAEAYWIGNELLEDFTKDDLRNLINLLHSNRLPDEVLEGILEKVLRPIIPTHLFQLLVVKQNLTDPHLSSCMVTWGEVTGLGEGLKVKGYSVEHIEGMYQIIEQEFSPKYDLTILHPKIGDYVAMHWDMAVMVLSEQQKNNLEKYTKKLIDSVNSAYDNQK